MLRQCKYGLVAGKQTKSWMTKYLSFDFW